MRWLEPVASQKRAWLEWVKSRPAEIRDAIKTYKLDPWTIYKLKTTDQLVTLRSIFEPGPIRIRSGLSTATNNQEIGKVTISVNIETQMTGLPMPRYGVFGIDPADLEEYQPTDKAKRSKRK